MTKRPKTEVIGIRLDEATAGRLRSLRPHLSEVFRDATMSDVTRRVLSLGLHMVDEEGPDILRDARAGRAELSHDNEEDT